MSTFLFQDRLRARPDTLEPLTKDTRQPTSSRHLFTFVIIPTGVWRILTHKTTNTDRIHYVMLFLLLLLLSLPNLLPLKQTISLR